MGYLLAKFQQILNVQYAIKFAIVFLANPN